MGGMTINGVITVNSASFPLNSILAKAKAAGMETAVAKMTDKVVRIKLFLNQVNKWGCWITLI